MRKTVVRLMLVSMLLVVAVPAYASEARQVWRCEMGDDVTEEQVVEAAQGWLKAAKTMAGGENLRAYVHFPVAVTNMGETDLVFTVVAPSFEEWGRFWDGYEGSAAAKAEMRNQDAVICPESALWEVEEVE